MEEVVKNKYGFSEIKHKPNQQELNNYYAEKYYKGDKKFNLYKKDYSASEKKHFNNRLNRKLSILSTSIVGNIDNKKVLDVGCGEGWTLKFLKGNCEEIPGLEFSNEAAKAVNPEIAELIIEGDVFANIRELIKQNSKYDVIILDNVLEHVIDSELYVKELKNLLSDKGVLIVEVPNDFSILQDYLLSKNKIDHPFWIAYPDHLSYFNYHGLNNIFIQNGWNAIHISCDYPIDMNLLNINTNYVKDKSKGKSVHQARIEWENLLDSISVEKTNKLFATYAEMGLGRNLIGYFQKQKPISSGIPSSEEFQSGNP